MHLDVDVDQERSATAAGKLVLAGLLAGVLGIGTYGVFLSTRIPSADTLIAKIEETWELPQKRFAEIDQFLDNYPSHVRAGEIAERKCVALAYQKIHQLRAKSKGTNPLSDIENKLLDIFDKSHNDKPKSLKQLKALVALYKLSLIHI